MMRFKGGLIALLSLLIIVIAALASGNFNAAMADTGNGSSLLSSPLYLDKVADAEQSDTPQTFFNGGNLDCANLFNDKCNIDTAYGLVGDSSLWVDGKYRPIYDYGGRTARFLPVPSSAAGLVTAPASGLSSYLFVYYNVPLTPSYKLVETGVSGVDNWGLDHFEISGPADERINDNTGQALTVDTATISYSAGSKWMLATSPDYATLRVNLTNGSILSFGRPVIYEYGPHTKSQNAITADGRYAAVAYSNSTDFFIYDLSTCSAIQGNQRGLSACQSRNLLDNGFIASRIPGYIGASHLRFLSDDTISFYASRKDGQAIKYAQYTLSTKPLPTRLQYLALGDSYISGEGAQHYKDGTDTATNHCHLSLVSYPYLLNYDVPFNGPNPSIACSGAVTRNITDASIDHVDDENSIVQAKGKASLLFDNEVYSLYEPGYRAQINFIQRKQPKVITVSIGGNDIGFSKILTRCLEPDTCYSSYEDRVELVREFDNLLMPRLINTYQTIKNQAPAGAAIYVIGYPQIVAPEGRCGGNVHLSDQERTFAQGLIEYLDNVIEVAANRAGVRYVDTQDALNGYRLCEAPSGNSAMNGVTAGNDRLLHTIGAESYHPTAFGYRLIEQEILEKTANLTEPMPSPNPYLAPPSEDNLDFLDVPHTGRQINWMNYDEDLSDDVQYRGGIWNIAYIAGDGTYQGFKLGLKALSKVKVVLHSEPIELGEFTTDEHGDLGIELTAPSDMPLGYHTLHIYGTDIANNSVDIQKVIYIADLPPTDPILSNTQGTLPPAESPRPMNNASSANVSAPNQPIIIGLTPQSNDSVITIPSNDSAQGKVLAESASEPAQEPDSVSKAPSTSYVPFLAAGFSMVALAAVLILKKFVV